MCGASSPMHLGVMVWPAVLIWLVVCGLLSKLLRRQCTWGLLTESSGLWPFCATIAFAPLCRVQNGLVPRLHRFQELEGVMSLSVMDGRPKLAEAGAAEDALRESQGPEHFGPTLPAARMEWRRMAPAPECSWTPEVPCIRGLASRLSRRLR